MTIEERVELLEKELTDLKRIVLGVQTDKDWRKSVGMSAADPDFAEMVRLGREIRQQSPES